MFWLYGIVCNPGFCITINGIKSTNEVSIKECQPLRIESLYSFRWTGPRVDEIFILLKNY